MINTSAKYKQELIKGNRNYVAKVEITLVDNTILTLANENIWEQGIVISQAISSDDSFDVGSAIVGSLKVVIDNISGSYNTYDFMNAHLTLWLGVENDTDLGGNQIFYRIGFYVVDDTEYNGSLITLSCLDNMTWFDVPFSKVNFPTTSNTTAGQLVTAICSYVGVTLGTTQFPNYTTTIYRQSLLNLAENDYNCREILQFVAQKCCCYCKINTVGQLVLTWHDKQAIIGIHNYDGGSFSTHTTPYSDGDEVDGMLFNPWNQGVKYDGGQFTDLQNNVWLSQNFDIRVSTDDITVTGCVIRSTLGQEDDHYDVIWVDSTLESTKPRYALVIENNPLILKAEAGNIANTVGNTLAYLPIRGFESHSLSDFSYETGDMATIVDFRGNVYYTWLTHFTFTINNSETFGCGVQSIRNRNESRFSTAVQTMLNADKVLSDYDKAVKAMNELAANAIGYKEYYYPSEATALDSRVTYRYNGSTIDTTIPSKPKFPNSTVVFQIAGDGVFVSRSKDSQGYPVFDNGYDANSGTAILNLLYAQGISCSVVKSGRLSLGGSNQSIYKNGELYVYDSNNAEVGHWTRDGISVKTGTITLGNKTSLTDNNTGVYIGSSGIALGVNPTFKVTDAGELTAKRGYIGNGANGWTIQDTSIYNGCSAIDSNNSGTYVGTNGFCNKSGTNVVTITDGGISANHGSIGGFDITADALGDKLGSSNCVGMKSGDKLFAWNPSGYTYIKWDEIYKKNGHIIVENGGDELSITHENIYCDAHGNVAWEGSDRKLKKNIKNLTLEEAQNLIYSVRPRKYEFKSEKGQRYGFIAQELRDILEDNSGIEFECNEIKNIHYSDFIAPLCLIVNDQQKEIDLLKQEVADLKARVK